ncbi:MAG: hypothetical protein M3O28_14895 [Actinomycetota bacterium]|nr:hypothetical protein [Actinomycetota bacterium]
MSAEPDPQHAAPSADPATPAVDQGPVLPDICGDDSDEGWGDDPRDSRRDEVWYRRERPPHHE